MKLVEPKVFLISEMKYTANGVADWLRYVGGQEAVDCLNHVDGSQLEQLIELLARRCYKSFAPGLNPNVKQIRTDSSLYHKNIMEQKHGSVMAHGHCTFAFEGVSRVFTHEVVRHAVGNDMSQESLRYVRLDDISFWIPPIIANETRAVTGYATHDGSDYDDVQRRFSALDIFTEVIQKCEWAQKKLAELYDIDNIKDFDTKKKLTSAFRRVAPEGLATGIGMTFNIRSLRWIIEQRTAPWAEEEIRIVFGKVAEIAMDQWRMVFQDFERVPDNPDAGSTTDLVWYRPKNSKI